MSILKNNKVIAVGDVNTYHPPILSCMWSDHIINDIQWLRADTFSWQSGDVYVTAYDKLVEEYGTGVEETEGSITFKRSTNGFKIADASQESAILSKYNTDGIAWYYILDTTNKRFKLPRTKFGFEGLRTNVGDDIDESLPNIKGTTSLGTWRNSQFESAGLVRYASGCMSCSKFFTAGGNSTSGFDANTNTADSIDFDASLSSSTYQDGAPVQERATQMYLYFYVGEFAQTAIEQTAGITSEQLNGKADVSTVNNKMNKDFSNASNLATINPMITSYVNGTSGYNIWANGYCEQWGQTATVNMGTSITCAFMKTFANTNYNTSFEATLVSTDDVFYKSECSSYTATSFVITNRRYSGSGTDTLYYKWKASGYLAVGQY